MDSEEYWGDKLVTASAKPVSQTNKKGHQMVLVRNGTRTQVNAYGIDLSSLSNGNEVDSEEYWDDKLVTVSAKPVSQTNKKGHQMVSFFVGARNGT